MHRASRRATVMLTTFSVTVNAQKCFSCGNNYCGGRADEWPARRPRPSLGVQYSTVESTVDDC